jgi:hypothetical protein
MLSTGLLVNLNDIFIFINPAVGFSVMMGKGKCDGGGGREEGG